MISVKSKVINNTLFLIGERGISMFISFLSFIVIAKYLGATQFGTFSYALSFVAIFLPISEWAYTTIVTKYLSINHSLIDIIKKSIKIRTYGFISSVILVFLISSFFNFSDESRQCIRILAIASVFDIFVILRSYFDANLQSRYFAYSQSLSTVLGGIARIAIVFIYPSVIIICYSFLFEKFIKASLLWFFFISKKQNFDNNQSKVSSGRIFSESLPLILTNLFIILNFKVDQLIIEYFMDMEAVGRYGVVAKISEIWYIIPTSLFASYFPTMAREEKEGKDSIQGIRKISRLLLLISVIISLFLSLIGENLINMLFGNEYEGLGGIISIHIWAGVFFFLGHPISKALIAKNLVWINFYGKLFTVAINIILNIILIEKFGLLGAAISTLISYSFGYYFFYLIHPKVKLKGYLF